MSALEIGAELASDVLTPLERSVPKLLQDADFWHVPSATPAVSEAMAAINLHEFALSSPSLLEGPSKALSQASNRQKAYKVLDMFGQSPAASSVRWSLPRKLPNGSWSPGEWLDVQDTPVNAYFQNTRRALHVSNVPQQWRLGHDSVRVFEAELSPPDQQVWDQLLSSNSLTPFARARFGPIPLSLRDFPAQRVRLVRELGV
ncbi:MAG TPA: hypothetical protein V6C81_15400 [Planktothrix sp.]|jgi:hypothetical protein